MARFLGLTISPNTKHLSHGSTVVKGNNEGTLGCIELPRGPTSLCAFPKTLESDLTHNQNNQTEGLSGSSQCSACSSCSWTSYSLVCREPTAISGCCSLLFVTWLPATQAQVTRLSFLCHSRELIASICYWNMRPKESIVSQPLQTRLSGQPCGRSRTGRRIKGTWEAGDRQSRSRLQVRKRVSSHYCCFH